MRADSRTAKMRAVITTVDPSTRTIHAQTVDGPQLISLIEVPGSFTWPREGESWSIYKENQTWILGSRMQSSEDQRRVEDLLPGQSLGPSYFQDRIPTGSVYYTVDHMLGSKALSSRLRPAFVGYTISLSTDIPMSLTSAFAAQESIPFGDYLRPATGYILIDDEIIYYGAQTPGETTAVFSTLSRGQLGTTAANHSLGSQGTLFSFTGSAVVPAHEIQPINNNKALIKFSSATTFPIDIGLIG